MDAKSEDGKSSEAMMCLHFLQPVPPAQGASFPSLMAHVVSQEMLHPLYTLPLRVPTQEISFTTHFQPLIKDLPCELHLVNLRTLQRAESTPGAFAASDDVALILHQLGVDCSFPVMDVCQVNGGKVGQPVMLCCSSSFKCMEHGLCVCMTLMLILE